jgi:microcin C transport system permease protein
MKSYLIRRLLLIIPTLLGITLVCFTLIQFVPGGPVEEAISRMRQVGAAKGMSAGKTISPEEVANIKAYFGFDKPAPIRYLNWVGNVLKGDLGVSYAYQEPVLKVIVSKMPISLFFGLTSFLLIYSVCIPLGMAKAMRHNSFFDSISSVVVFTGNVIPDYALGIVLIVFLGGGSYLNFFPISGIVSEQFESLSLIGKGLDFLHHMVLPMICYMVGGFAFLTMLMKNSLLEELGKDYIRTALVKGSSLKNAVRRHALRNALVPLATGAGSIFTLMFSGSVLIERVFDIDGMGLLFYNSTISRDYNVVLGLILLSSSMALLGRLFADILYVLVDPRIRLS